MIFLPLKYETMQFENHVHIIVNIHFFLYCLESGFLITSSFIESLSYLKKLQFDWHIFNRILSKQENNFDPTRDSSVECSSFTWNIYDEMLNWNGYLLSAQLNWYPHLIRTNWSNETLYTKTWHSKPTPNTTQEPSQALCWEQWPVQQL